MVRKYGFNFLLITIHSIIENLKAMYQLLDGGNKMQINYTF
jgi:hypothetical protein